MKAFWTLMLATILLMPLTAKATARPDDTSKSSHQRNVLSIKIDDLRARTQALANMIHNFKEEHADDLEYSESVTIEMMLDVILTIDSSYSELSDLSLDLDIADIVKRTSDDDVYNAPAWEPKQNYETPCDPQSDRCDY